MKKRISELRPLWQQQLPMVHALEPWGLARLNALYRTVPDHPDSPRLEQVLYEWGLRSGLFTPETAGDITRSRIGHIAYWIQPQASPRIAEMIGAFLLWTISTDDSLVEVGAPLDDLKRACDEILRTGHTNLPLIPQARYFLDLRAEVISVGAAGLLPQIADQIEFTFQTSQREQRFMADDVLPSLPSYLQLRVGTAFMFGPVHAQRCEQGLLPPDRWFDERLEQIAALAGVVTVVNGDIAGYRKDLEMSFFPMNIIPILASDFSVDLATAYRMSLDVLELYQHILEGMVAEVCTESAASDPARAAQARAIAQWPHGFHTSYTRAHRHGVSSDQAQRPASDWRSGPLWQQLSRPGAPETRPFLHPGVAAVSPQWSAEKDATPTEQLLRWAAGTLGWHAPRGAAGGATATATATAMRIPGPAGLGAATARIHSLGARPRTSAATVTRDAPPDFPATIAVRRESYRNWTGNIRQAEVWTCEPRDTAEVVVLVNWARAHGYRVRAKGRAHGFSPLTITGRGAAAPVLLVDTTKHMTAMKIAATRPAAVQVGVGATMDALLAFLEAHGYGLAAVPAIGDLSVGGVLAIDAHGTGIPAAGPAPSGHLHGSMSNHVVALTAVVWDEQTRGYVARTFDRSDPDCAALLVHLGRALLTEVTLRVGANVALRCVSEVAIPGDALFAAPDAAARTGSTFGELTEQAGRVEVFWFPYIDRTWVKLWTPQAAWSPTSRPATAPYNYLFVNNVPEPVSELVRRVTEEAPERSPELEALQFANIVEGLAATASADLTGPSKNVLLYAQPSSLRYITNGYAVLARRADIQRVVHEFTAFFRERLRAFQRAGMYPINGQVEIRVTGLDHAGEVEVSGAGAPALSAIAPDPRHPEWDVAVWFDLLTFPGTRHADDFYGELERFILANYRPPYALARVEWSKGWAYTPEGPWTNHRVLAETIPATFGDAWRWARARLDAYDPHRIYGNEFIDRLL